MPFCAARASFLCLHPAFFDDLRRAAEGQRIGRHILCETRCRADVRAFADSNWCDQDTVAAYEYSVFNDRLVLLLAVVVARDRACAHVDVLADFGVSQISQVIGLRSFAEASFFHFYKISHVRAFADIAARAQMAVRTKRSARPYAGVFQDATRLNQGFVSDFAALDHAVGTNASFAADARGAEKLHERFNHGV